MDTYIWRRHNTVAQNIATRSLLDLCEAKDRTQGERTGMMWWEQAGIDMSGARDKAAAEEAEEDGMEE